MKVVKVKAKDARLVLLRMVADSAVCGAISAKWEREGLFSDRASNLIGSWAVKHFRKFGKAPRLNIRAAYDRWASNESDDEVQEFVGRFLESLSKELKQKKHVHSSVILDLAAEVFDKAKIRRINDEASAALEAGNIKLARKLMNEYRPVEVATTAGIDLFAGGAVARNAMRNMSESLIKWPQEAQRLFFGPIFAREEFISIMAGEKVGKSFYLQEIAILGVESGLNVAFFEVGDQSQNQIIRRFAARCGFRPFRADTLVRIPTQMTPNEDMPEVVHKHKKFKDNMTPKECSLALKTFQKKYGPQRLMMSVHPNSSINVHGIENILRRWERELDWRADLVVIDYIDILAPIEGRADTRDQINATWKALRRLNQETHCCLVGGTQANAESYKVAKLTKSQFSEDKRKHAHVTAEISINQPTEIERSRQLCRLNWVFGRDLDVNSDKFLWCAQCLALANPMVLTCFN